MKLTQQDGARLMAAHEAAVHTAEMYANFPTARNKAAADRAEQRFAEIVAEYTDSEGL
jgi:hypothetical protein